MIILGRAVPLLPVHLAEHVAMEMSKADDDEDDDDDEDEKKDDFLEAAEQVISSVKQTGQVDTPPSAQVPLVQDGGAVKPLSDPSHKLSDHVIESRDGPVMSSASDPSHTLEDHIADDIVGIVNDQSIERDSSDLIPPDVQVDLVPGRVSWFKPKRRNKSRKHIHRRKSGKEMPFSNGWKHTQEEHNSGSEEDKMFHQFEDMYDENKDEVFI